MDRVQPDGELFYSPNRSASCILRFRALDTIIITFKAGATERRPCESRLYYCLQIFQMTPVPGICSNGPLLAPTK